MDESDSAAACRRLMRRQGHAALATSFDGRPYVSLAAIAFGYDASPLLLLSDLAQHSRNIAADPRVSLLFDGGPRKHPPKVPLAEPRLSLLGEAGRCENPGLLARFTARHPSASAYAGFDDFHLYRVSIERGHLVAGFGRISWIDGGDLCFAGDAAALAAAEEEIVAHMNEDHADAVALVAETLRGRPAGPAEGPNPHGSRWRMTGIDPEGIDLRREAETARLDFAAPLRDPAEARQALIDLTAAARRARNP